MFDYVFKWVSKADGGQARSPVQNSDIPQTKIILIRHGQTAWNKQEIFRGRADVPLDEVGLRQAQALADALCAEPISRVFTLTSSPL